MEKMFKIAIVEDDESLNLSLVRVLKKANYHAQGYLNAETLYNDLKRDQKLFDLILCDHILPGMKGLELFKKLKKEGIDTNFIIITGLNDLSLAVESIKSGALDFLLKPVDKEFLLDKIKSYLERETEEDIQTFERLKEKIIFKSKIMQEILKKVSRISKSNISILLEGESGVGKEIMAKAIHSISERNAFPFVALNCSAIPEALFESELFGYKKGSFTGAYKDYEGIARSASGGTLFLDEVGELSFFSQAKLLRFLETKEVQPLGDTKRYKADARIISATNSDLFEKIEKKLFREDLFYRIAGIKIKIPPLRERKEDIIPISEHILKEIAKEEKLKNLFLAPSAIEKIISYPWYGNIRELRNRLYEAALNCSGGKIEAKDIIFEKKEEKTFQEMSYIDAKRYFEKEYFEKMLIQTKGNIKEIAKISGLSRKAIYEILKKHNIDPEKFRK